MNVQNILDFILSNDSVTILKLYKFNVILKIIIYPNVYLLLWFLYTHKLHMSTTTPERLFSTFENKRKLISYVY